MNQTQRRYALARLKEIYDAKLRANYEAWRPALNKANKKTKPSKTELVRKIQNGSAKINEGSYFNGKYRLNVEWSTESPTAEINRKIEVEKTKLKNKFDSLRDRIMLADAEDAIAALRELENF